MIKNIPGFSSLGLQKRKGSFSGLEGIAKLALEAKFDDFCAGPVGCMVVLLGEDHAASLISMLPDKCP